MRIRLLPIVFFVATTSIRGQDAVRDLALSASGSPNPVNAGTSLTYSIVVTVPAGGGTGIAVTDVLPAGVTYVLGTPNCTNNQGTVTCLLGNLAAGNATVTIVVTPPEPGTITNVVGVVGDQYDANMANNSAMVSTTVSGAACGITSITPSVGPITGGQVVTIAGACFTGATNVVFQSAFTTPSWYNDPASPDTRIFATTPGLPIGYGPVNVIVVKGSTSYTLPNGYTYSRGWTFTDDPIVAGQTTIKAIHITELRQDVDALRARAGLGGVPWTNNPLQARGTIVRAVHVQELRTYLNDVLTRLGYATSPYTDPGLGAGTTIRAVHINELRQRIRNVPN